MTAAKSQRVMTWCSVLLIVLGVPGAIFAPDSLTRNAQFLAIGMGVVGLLMARVFLPWAHRRAQGRPEE